MAPERGASWGGSVRERNSQAPFVPPRSFSFLLGALRVSRIIIALERFASGAYCLTSGGKGQVARIAPD